MKTLKPTHKLIKAYYNALSDSCAFSALLKHCANQFKLKFLPKYPNNHEAKNPVNGVFLNNFKLSHGIWETQRNNFNTSTQNNILFQTPQHLVLWQNGKEIFNENIEASPEQLINGLNLFFEYHHPTFEQWQQASLVFKEQVKEHGNVLLLIIKNNLETNQDFIKAFDSFTRNLNISVNRIIEMLIQHILMERIFRNIFNPHFLTTNRIATDIERLIATLNFNRYEFLEKLEPFYLAIEAVATACHEFTQKNDFLNTVYEDLFQSNQVVDTPQSVVNFMVKSVEDILQKEFQTSLAQKNVKILDPFVGTGHFIVRIMHEMSPKQLQYQYLHHLHCNEMMLIPYYIAILNIEHTYYERMGQYKPFENISLVDAFESLEEPSSTPICVTIGKPPYKQCHDTKKHTLIEQWITKTYAKDSKAANKTALFEPYVKAIRWASNHSEGIVAFITNNVFLDSISLDGMRQHLAQDFSNIYILNLGGNVRTNSKISGVIHNVLGIQVGLSINILIKKKDIESGIFYAKLNDEWRKEIKYRYLDEKQSISKIDWQCIKPEQKNIWLTEGLHPEFDTFIPLGTKKTKNAKTAVTGVIFKTYSRGIATCRDALVYNFNQKSLISNIQAAIGTYNEQVLQWKMTKASLSDYFILSDLTKIRWSESLKANLKRGRMAIFEIKKVRQSLYRPFTKVHLFFDRVFNERVYVFPSIFPISDTETENNVICCTNHSQSPFVVQITNHIPDVAVGGRNGQCFPFYTYKEDGSHRTENITDWALKHYRTHYQDNNISKWDIFYYIYGLLHHRHYNEKYALNLKRELSRIPLAPNFWGFSKGGEQLANLHLNYDQQAEYPLNIKVNPNIPFNLRVKNIKFIRGEIIYNDSITISGIPAETFEYRLGKRSALAWVIDQYSVKTDKYSGLIKNPNRLNDERYIIRLIGQIVTVSLKTVEIVKGLPEIISIPQQSPQSPN